MSPSLPRRSTQEPAAQVRLFDRRPKPADLRAEVLHGLSLPRKALPPKLFYDREGSRLFDAITELPEYYPTRTEIGILRAHGPAMAEQVGPGRTLIELGSGSSLKIQILLAALAPALYVPVDISRDHLLASAKALARRFPGLQIDAVCADYSAPFDLPLDRGAPPPAAFFPGSSIGNFEPAQAWEFLARIGRLVGAGGCLLIGVDLVKDRTRLEAAYNDAQGVTAAFNRNLLARLNRELGANFVLHTFEHLAFFNPSPDPRLADGPGRIEMHLVSTRAQQVQIEGCVFSFRDGETIHTESSYKYDLPGFARLAAEAGFTTEQVWTDAQSLFSVHCLRSGLPSSGE